MKSYSLSRAFRFLLIAALLAPLWARPSAALAAPPWDSGTALEIDLKAPPRPISPTLHGLMTEEINHSYDGGLYAELVRNRAFLDDARNEPVHWSGVPQPGAAGAIHVVANQPLTDKLPNSLEGRWICWPETASRHGKGGGDG
jgi:alpha-N-arabinofuranosidase